MPPKSNSINSLRQQLRNRLFKIGMLVDSNGDGQRRYKKVRGKTQEDDNLPVLQPFRTSTMAQQDIKKLLTSNYLNLADQRRTQKELSKQILKGVKCDKSLNSSRQFLPSNNHQIHKKIMSDARALRTSQKLPLMKSPYVIGPQIWSQTFRIQRVDRQVNAQDIQNDVKEVLIMKSQRSKTQEKEKEKKMMRVTKSNKKMKKSLGKQLAPWQGDINRDTHIFFNC